jgi:histidinol-phosphate aminotransferase
MESTANVGVASILARKNILDLLPYRCARDDYSSGILLDANENAFGPPIANDHDDPLERYPDPYQIPLKNKICSFRNGFNLSPNNVFVGVVSREQGFFLLL